MSDLPNSSSGPLEHQGYVIDAENAAEMARLMLMDQLLTRAMGGPISEQSDLSQTHRVLDIACGPGGWLFDLVTQYPHIHGVGIDISQLMIEYATSLVRMQGLPIQFHVMDATQPLDFPDSTFDLLNARILTGFLTTQQWPLLLAECYRITKPGGILRLTEGEWGFTNSPAYDTLQRGMCVPAVFRNGHSFSPHGYNVGTASVLRLLLRQAGYQQIQNRAHVVDYSAGTEMHESNCQNMLVFHKLLQPFLMYMQIATQDELDQLFVQMETEMMAEDFCAIDFFLTAWGRKPLR